VVLAAIDGSGRRASRRKNQQRDENLFGVKQHRSVLPGQCPQRLAMTIYRGERVLFTGCDGAAMATRPVVNDVLQPIVSG
jgi:hypothetical protein